MTIYIMKIIFLKCQISMSSLCKNFANVQLDHMELRKIEIVNAKSCQKLANCTLRDLDIKVDVHGRRCLLSYLNSLPISVLRNLDTEANRFYDRTDRLYDAALLTRCYTQHYRIMAFHLIKIRNIVSKRKVAMGNLMIFLIQERCWLRICASFLSVVF